MSAPRPSRETKLPTANSRDKHLLAQRARSASFARQLAGTSGRTAAPIGPDDDVVCTDVSDSTRSTPRTFLMACVAREILSSDAGEKTSSPAGRLDADDGDAQRAEAARDVLEQAHVGIVGRQKDEQVLFVAQARRADGGERGDEEADGDDGTRPAGGEGDELIHRQRR